MRNRIHWMAAGLCLAASAQLAAQAVVVRLTADTNRDGVIERANDAEGRDEWSWQRGAVFMNNCDSDGLTALPDSEDTIVNGTADLDDLAPLALEVFPPQPATSVLRVTTNAPAGTVRLFYRAVGGEFVPVPTDGVLPITLTSSLTNELRIEGRSFARQGWNGQLVVTAQIERPDTTPIADAVRMRVAPFLLMSNFVPGRILYVREYPTRNDTFVSQLRTHTTATNTQLVIVPRSTVPPSYPANQIWLQDSMEIGYTEAPGDRRMNVVLKSNRNQAVDSYPRDFMRGPDFGWIQVGSYRAAYAAGGGGNEWIDWYGNLEVTPPVPGYPHGRVYYGVNGSAGLNPEIVNMLAAQELQGPPLALDTGWLLIKHVDEMICFVPSGNSERPWKVLVPDTGVMERLMDRWISEGRGGLSIFPIFETAQTVSTIRNNATNLTYNRNLMSQRIEPMITAMKAGFGLVESDIIRIPAWYENTGGSQAGSIMPNMINAAVLNGRLLMADPDGPVVGGADLVQQEVVSLLAGLPIEPHFLDDRQYHIWSGNVHCGTNVARMPTEPMVFQSAPAASPASAFLMY